MAAQIIDILHDHTNNEVTYDINISSGKRRVTTIDSLSKKMKTISTTEDIAILLSSPILVQVFFFNM